MKVNQLKRSGPSSSDINNMGNSGSDDTLAVMWVRYHQTAKRAHHVHKKLRERCGKLLYIGLSYIMPPKIVRCA